MSEAVLDVLIADDHPIVREGLRAVIDDQPRMRVVAEASTGAEAVELAAKHRPDVLLLDLRMPELGGVEAIQAIRAEWPEARILVLTTYDGDEDIYRALQAGALAYLLKGTSRVELLEAIRAVGRGQRLVPPTVAAKLAERVAGQELTARELDVLRLIVAGRSNKEIGEDLALAEGTVKFHVNNLLGKLGVADRTQAATEALRRGLVHLG
jgi:two-component system NarL family response regulator